MKKNSPVMGSLVERYRAVADEYAGRLVNLYFADDEDGGAPS